METTAERNEEVDPVKIPDSWFYLRSSASGNAPWVTLGASKCNYMLRCCELNKCDWSAWQICCLSSLFFLMLWLLCCLQVGEIVWCNVCKNSWYSTFISGNSRKICLSCFVAMSELNKNNLSTASYSAVQNNLDCPLARGGVITEKSKQCRNINV